MNGWLIHGALALTIVLVGCGSSGTSARGNGGARASGGTSTSGGATASGGAGGVTSSGGSAPGGASNAGGHSSGGTAGAIGSGGSGGSGGSAGQYVIVPPGPNSDVKIEVQYHSRTAATSNDIQPEIQIQNKILTSVLLNELEIHYYMTLNGEEATPLTWTPYGAIPNPVKCCFVSLTNQMVLELVTMPTPVTGADHYLKVTFTTDNTIFLRYTDVADLRLSTYTNDPLVQSNDYSFNPTTTFIDWDHITVYRSGKLVWGKEPG